VFENRLLKRIFGHNRDKVARRCRRLHNEELHKLYAPPNIIRVITSRRLRWAGHVARIGEMRNGHRILIEKPDGKRPLRRSRNRWKDIFRMNIREIVREIVG
jgi:hypothetical protein